MNKRIVICADGTWNRPEKDLKVDFPTNVLRLARAISPMAGDGKPQQVFYDWGVGSYYDEVIGGTTGRGLHKNIMDGYRYIVQNYSPGDEIYLFGFSRGAYTVRCLCGLINNCGILKRPDARLIQQAFDHYKKAARPLLQAAINPLSLDKSTAMNHGRLSLLGCGIRWALWGSRFPSSAYLKIKMSFTTLKLVAMCGLPAMPWR